MENQFLTKKIICITLIKSISGRLKSHIQCAKGLGLKKINHRKYILNTPENRGMIKKISYLLKIGE